ncbi:MAG: mip [Gammaproteobacteria bacterium]|jgi:FKBP-type peptidyl-prolyl cis-trans isomerase|nr:mip [Gammaproteobacteria bacterium]
MKLLSVLVGTIGMGLGILSMSTYAVDELSTTSQATTATEAVAPVVDENKAEGNAFLAKNKNNKGVVTLPDGLQYKIIVEGKGPMPTDTDVVSVNYAGTFINGEEFDSSYKRNEPASFPVGGVIPGWTEALKLMPVGSTWMLYIPSDLAYGEAGSPPVIPPNKTLIFKVELLKINNK